MATVARVRGAAKVLPNSKNLEEARRRTIDFFKKACRSLPAVMEIYNLHDVVTISQLRSTISSEIRKNSQITNPKVIDMLIFKGEEELTNIIDHAKQRHHIIGQYVLGREGLVKEVIDMLIFKGEEELTNTIDHAKQRHHIIGQYVLGHEGLVKEVGTKEQGISDFLRKFYESNYF